ncbi:calmodulin-binding receptor-like cytoplasmic kinase 2 isoform X1 [Oryza brachyantha]|uniref:non-specific serine/threonine protein kinase n=1 Tax=Oryza brachyantha TaxID=4533 RepID=J3L5W7_ORYBR|nr:calmodulin-binding receptor-like cytoplasmic kinase 2 isoform X1 [Oryza brachyantha]
MRAARHREFSTTQGRESTSFNHEFQSDPGFSWTSTYAARSPKLSKKGKSSKSFWEVVDPITRACTNCFAPRQSKIQEGHVKPSNDGHDISISSIVSRISSTSSTSTNTSNQRGDDIQKKSWQEQFSFQEICVATSNFSEQHKIGLGNFGTVYRGKLRDGSIIAVKRATKNMYDRHLSEEFRSEIRTLSKVEHLNLVKFLGYLEHEDERLILVEYVNNGSLREHLDGLRGEPLDFSQRLNIAIDIVHAVSYLHGYTDHPIIHRDIKSSNILLTDQLRAKVADFGFARLAPDNTEATHVSTMVKGTAGYVDPEYMRTNQLTDRSDVYSFGVLLVELLTGRRPIERGRGRQQRLTTQWALRKCRDGDAVVAMDARMRRTSAVVAAMEKVMALAAECIAQDRAARPAMRRCAEVLWSIRRDFQHEQQRAAAVTAAGARAKRHDGSTYGPSITSLKE